MTIAAVIFDFNGTLSDDEPVLDELYQAMAADLRVALTSADYWRDLAGLSDPAIVDALLDRTAGEPREGQARARRRAELLAEKVRRYVALAPPLAADVVALVRRVAAQVPVAVASGAPRAEVEHVLGAAGVLGAFAAIVCAEDVERGKPDPAGYALALERLNAAAGTTVVPADVLCVEDADAGVTAAHAAGMRCAALSASPAYSTGADVELAALTDLQLEPAPGPTP